jgi:HAD superfamily hydrolase (TIGR01509 family)
MGALQLVIFDCDGVLVDSEPISNRVLAQMLSDEGLPITTKQAREAFQGLRLDGVLAEAERRLGRKLPRDFVQDYEQQRAQAFRLELRAVSGAAEAVAEVLAAGIPVCVASQGKLQKTALSLQLTGLDGLFPVTTRFSAHTVAHGKPHPALFEHAAAAMGADPCHCAVVEDTPSGVTAAVRARMRVLGYAADSDADALREAGAEVMGSLHELPQRLGLG